MTEKSLLSAIKTFIFVILVGVPLFYFSQGVYPYTLSKILFFQAAVEILFFLWLALAVSSPRYRPKMTPLLWAGAAFLSAYLIASLGGVDLWRSLWSTYERGIGFFALLHFAALGVVVSSLYRELPWKKIFYSSLATSAVVSVIAYIQIYIPDLLLIENPGVRPGSTFGNPAMMAGYLNFNVFLALYILLSEFRSVAVPNGKPKGGRLALWFAAAVAAIDAFTVFFTQTRADILGLAVGLFALLLIFAIRPPESIQSVWNRRSTYAYILAFMVFFSLVFFVTRENQFWEKVPGLSRFRSISLTDYSSNIGPRLSALNAGWKGFLEKPVLGWGPGNFMPVYDRYYDPRSLEFSYVETRFDKPHNLFLEYASTGGIVLFAAFLALLGAAIYEAARQKDKIWLAVFAAALAAYGIDQFFFFENLGSLLMLFLFLGAINGAFREGGDKLLHAAGGHPAEAGGGKHVSPVVAGACLAAALVPLYAVNVQSLKASYYQYLGFQSFLQQNIFTGLRHFEKSINIQNPYSWNFKRDYAIAVAGQYFNYPGTVSDDNALKAVKAMEEVRDAHPKDAFNHFALVNLYNEIASIDLETYTKKAEDAAKIALEISPRRQETYFYLAKTKTIEKDYQGALAILKKVLEENPKVPDAHFYYGLLAFAVGDSTTGYNEIKTAISMGREWKTFHEPRTIANFFADSGHLGEAIPLYKAAWELSYHSDIDTEVKLGVVYFIIGQHREATFYLKDAVGRFDVAKSPSYGQLKPILEALGIKL